jgi:hypothetical protein
MHPPVQLIPGVTGFSITYDIVDNSGGGSGPTFREIDVSLPGTKTSASSGTSYGVQSELRKDTSYFTNNPAQVMNIRRANINIWDESGTPVVPGTDKSVLLAQTSRVTVRGYTGDLGCQDDDDCPSVCDVDNNTCVDCLKDSDCTDCFMCIDKSCIPDPCCNCTGTCVGEPGSLNRRCVECAQDDDCPAGVCVAERCVECRTQSDCPIAGNVCVNNSCCSMDPCAENRCPGVDPRNCIRFSENCRGTPGGVRLQGNSQWYCIDDCTYHKGSGTLLGYYSKTPWDSSNYDYVNDPLRLRQAGNAVTEACGTNNGDIGTGFRDCNAQFVLVILSPDGRSLLSKSPPITPTVSGCK